MVREGFFKALILEFAGCVPAPLAGEGLGVAYGKVSRPPGNILRDGLQAVGSSIIPVL